MLAQFMGWTSFANWIATKSGTFILCAVCIIGSYLTIVFGMRVYKAIQKPLVILAILGPAVIAVALVVTTKADFISHWNALARQYHSLPYQSFTAAAGAARGATFPHSWSWPATIGCMDGAFLLFVYNYFIVYVGGEVKRPDRALLSANALAVAIPAALGLWTVIGLYRIMSFSFFGATQWVTLGGGTLKGYNFPYPPNYMTLGWIASHGNWFVAVIACVSFLVVTYLEVTLSIMGCSRILFAWGMDRMGPKWFTDISPRWAAPVKSYTIVSAILFIGTAAYVL
jgi:amino acid transporter